MLPPVKSFSPQRAFAFCCPAFPSLGLTRASRGTKNLRADLVSFNSASQTFVNSQPFYLGCAGCQKLFSVFLHRSCNLATSIKLPTFQRLSKTFFNFFQPPKLPVSQRTRPEISLLQNLRNTFLNFFFYAFQGRRSACIPAQKVQA